MSSLTVRNKVLTYVVSLMPADFPVADLETYFCKDDLPSNSDRVLIQSIVSDETIVGFPDHYREEGKFLIHYITKKNKSDVANALAATKTLRDLLRNTNRIDNLIEVVNVGTPKYGSDDSLKLKGSDFGITFYLEYRFDFQREGV